MKSEEDNTDLTDARDAYFAAADAVTAKIEERYGTGREGFEPMLREGFAKMGKPVPESLKS